MEPRRDDGEVSGAEDGSEEESEEGQEKWRSPRGWMGAGAEAALEDQAQASSGQAQSDRELEAGRLMDDSRFWFIYLFIHDLVFSVDIWYDISCGIVFCQDIFEYF